ncbi:hypothetical protein VTK26DRAFT_7941 [Humicola hyalothermophila]
MPAFRTSTIGKDGGLVYSIASLFDELCGYITMENITLPSPSATLRPPERAVWAKMSATIAANSCRQAARKRELSIKEAAMILGRPGLIRCEKRFRKTRRGKFYLTCPPRNPCPAVDPAPSRPDSFSPGILRNTCWTGKRFRSNEHVVLSNIAKD